MSRSFWRAFGLCLCLRLTAFGQEPSVDFHLDQVQDRTFLEEVDVEGYYGLLNQARQQEVPAVSAAAQKFLAARRPQSKKFGRVPPEKFPLFADLLNEPEPYRGQPVTLRGHSQEMKRYAAEENPYGITTLYECSLFTDDSQSHPTTVVFTEAPADLPLGEQIVDGVVVSGYFLKLRAYYARDEKTRVAPLILARSITWRRDRVASSWIGSGTQYALYAGLTLIVIGWLVLRWSVRPPRKPPGDAVQLGAVEIRD
jgi:hypothetical protein